MREILGEQGVEFDDRRSVISCKERNRNYIANNILSKRVIKYRIDGGMIHAGKKCDYGLAVYETTDTGDSLYLIELKGNHLSKAANQINTTILNLSDKIRRLDITIKARIVLSKTPIPNNKLHISEYKTLLSTIKKYKGNIKEGTQRMSEDI